MYTGLTVKGWLSQPNKGDLFITAQPGRYQMPVDSTVPELSFTSANIHAQLTAQQLTAKGLLTLDPHKKIQAKIKVPHFNLQQGFSREQFFSSQVSLIMDSLDILDQLADIKHPQGHLVIQLKSKGSLAHPKLNSELHLTKGAAEIPALGIKIDNATVNATSKGQQWQGTGSLYAEHQPLFLKGKGSLSKEFTADLSLEGTAVPIVNTPYYHIKVSPKLTAHYAKALFALQGNLLIPYARIQPQTFTNSIDASSDIIIRQTTTAPPSSPLHTTMDVQVVMGDDVELTAQGLHAKLQGNGTVKQIANGPINAVGALRVEHGEYKAYGQNLTVEQGELIFTGGQITNPGINLRAFKKIDTATNAATENNQLFNFNNDTIQTATIAGNISVGVEVSGHLTEPKIQLYSNPAILSQADILSMLILGRPASQANKAGGQLLLAALSSMNLGGGTKGKQLVEQLKQSIGVDFNIQTNSNYNLITNTVNDNTALVVSKPLSKRISLSYNIGFSQADPNVLTLKYLLNKFLSVQISTSTSSSGIDLLYTHIQGLHHESCPSTFSITKYCRNPRFNTRNTITY